MYTTTLEKLKFEATAWSPFMLVVFATLMLLKVWLFPTQREHALLEETLIHFPVKQKQIVLLEKKLSGQDSCMERELSEEESTFLKSPQNMTEVTQELFRLGAESKIKLRKSAPQGGKLSLTVTGSFSNVLSFFDALYLRRTTYQISSMELKQSKEVQMVLGVECLFVSPVPTTTSSGYVSLLTSVIGQRARLCSLADKSLEDVSVVELENPFGSKTKIKRARPSRTDDARFNREPLTVKAIMVGDDIMAVVQDKSGENHFVKAGDDLLGRSVISVDSESVVVRDRLGEETLYVSE